MARAARSASPATLFATVGVLPYIALQLQAVSSTFRTVAEPAGWIDGRAGVVHTDTSLIGGGADGGVHDPVPACATCRRPSSIAA